MRARLLVRRFDPEDGRAARYQAYEVDAAEQATVLEALIHVREQLDPSLAMRCSCRSAVCGSCAMRINGQARLACKTKLADLAADGGPEIVIEPLGNMPTIKDLVTQMDPFWEKVREIRPWLEPPDAEPARENLVSREAMLELAGIMNCVMCGACVSDCTVLEVDKRFLAPAALAKACRFVCDPRDSATLDRLRQASRYGGIWDCTRCNICVEVCPKGVEPLERILHLRRRALEAGLSEHVAAGHVIEFEAQKRKASWMGE